MIRRFLNRIAARRLGSRSWANRETSHDRIIETTREIRRELGLGEDRRLGNA